MKTLILSCNMGGGHNSAAMALAEYGAEKGIECEIADTLSFVSPAFSQTMSDLYIFTTKSNLIKIIYKAGESVPRSRTMKSPVYVANKIYCKKLYDYIRSGNFDAIICTHVFPAEALTSLRRTGLLTQKCVFVQTDYDALPLMKDLEVDGIVIPHLHLVEECVAVGARRELLFPYGIPVCKVFFTRNDKSVARNELIHSMALPDSMSCRWYLIMSGSMGFGKTELLIQEIIAKHGQDVEIFAVCGSNHELKLRLDKCFSESRHLHTIGFTNKVSMLMDACDVLFTKPGGLSRTEAAAKNIPLVHTAPIPGCETDNARFFHYHGMSYSTVDVQQQVAVADKLCTDSAYRMQMQLAQQSNIFSDTCKNIFSLIG